MVCTDCKQSTMARKGILQPECRYCGAKLDRYSLVSLDGFPIEVGRRFDTSDQDFQMVQPISLKDASGPVTVLTRVYQLGDPDQRKQFEMDSHAQDWAAAVWSIWDRMCKERDNWIEGSGSNEGIAAYGVLQEAISILNDELEKRGLDLEASCG